MATGTTTNDREFLFRLQTLIIDGGTLVIRNTFDKKLPILPLYVYLANEKTTINRLRAQKTITRTQYDQLYPQSGQPPSSADFDITLLICLLRNLRSLGLNPIYSWHTTPQPADTSVEADLCRLKGFRNEVAHISSTSGIQQTGFQTKWTEIEQVLLRLNSAVANPVPNLKQTFDDYLNDPLDPVAEIRIQTEIKQWRKMEKGLETEIQLLKKDVTENVKETLGLKDDVTKVKQNVEVLPKVQENIKTLTEDVTKVKQHVEVIPKVQGNIKTLTEDVTEVKQHVEIIPKVQENIKTLTEDVTKVKQHVEVIPKVQGNIKTLTEDVTKVKQHVEVIPQVQENIKTLTEDVTKVKQHVEVIPNVQGTIKTLTDDVKGAKEIIEKEQKNIEILKQNTFDFTKTVQEVTEGVREVREMKGDLKEMKQHIDVLKEDVTEVKENVSSDQRVQKKTGIFQRIFRNVFSSREKELQEDLVLFYRRQHRTISMSPLLEEETPLLEFYVMPDILSVEVKRTPNGVEEEKVLVTPFGNMFFKGNNLCNEIYLTADAGLGKTALSKRVTLAWCHAKKPQKSGKQYFSPEEIKAVNGFHFVFLLLLLDSSSQCDIDDFIMTQIISELVRPYTREFLENILFKERCLVILDGLDEWSHPLHSCKQGSSSIPHRKARERTAVLTTTRPWKLSVSGLKSSHIDKKLELVGLNPKSANVLKRSVISHLFHEKDTCDLDKHVMTFTTALEEKQITDLEVIPLLLMYLLFLWCNKIDLGQSQCDLYSQITELLLSRTVQNYIELSPKVDLPHGDIPQCFSGKIHCTQFYTLLIALGQLAYHTLFRETTEETTLVFDSSVAEQYLNKDYLNFCLKTGLITQSKVPIPGTLLEQKFKVSFSHKTVQEFFAALYMYSNSDQTSVPEIVLSKCKCIKDILELSKILKFSCGMNVNVSSLIFREMMKIINEDGITREYRSSIECDVNTSYPLKDFQDMCISCFKEVPHESEVSFCLQDVFIETSCKQEQYCKNLKQLTTKNNKNIRSLYIKGHKILFSLRMVIDYFELNDLENIEKIHHDGFWDDRDIVYLLNRSIKSFYLTSIYEYWSFIMNEKVISLQKLKAICIISFKMRHRELTLLYNYISKLRCMRQIQLLRIECTSHGSRPCTGYSLNLSNHSQLNHLVLKSTPVSELNINMVSLETCFLEDVSNPDLVLRFINHVPANSKLKQFECTRLKSPVAIEMMMETLRLSVHVKHVGLWWINLSNGELLTSNMVSIKFVRLGELTMNASTLQGIVDVVQQQPQTVEVAILRCEINPKSEFVSIKKKKTSRRHFKIEEDSKGVFIFKTIKQGNLTLYV